MNTGLLAVLPTSVTAFFITYLLFKTLDFTTGILKTFKSKESTYKSRKMRDGIVRWVAELLAISFVIILDIVLGLNFILCMMTLSLFLYKEGGSILENLYECGVELPQIIVEKLEVFNKGDVE